MVPGPILHLIQLDSVLVEIEPPSYMQGQAFEGKFKTNTPRKFIHGHADRFDESVDMIRAVRDRRFKYLKNLVHSLQKSKTPLDEVVVTAQIGEESVYKSSPLPSNADIFLKPDLSTAFTPT